MLHLVFVDLIEQPARRLCLLSWGVFVAVESLILLPRGSGVSLFFLAAGTFLTGLAVPRSVSAFYSGMRSLGIDQVFLVFLAAASWLVNRLVMAAQADSSSKVPAGILVSQLSLPQEVFSLLMASVAVTVIIPAWSDPSLVGVIRELDHYPAIPFTRRRTLSALGVVVLFWAVGLVVLSFQARLIVYSCFVAIWFAWAITYWEYVYGYRSRIVYLFGALALALSILGIIIGGDPTSIAFVFDLGLFYPVLGLPIVALVYAVLHSLRLLWGAEKKKYIVDDQKTSHTFLILSMALGCLAIYVAYIMWPMYAHWAASRS